MTAFKCRRDLCGLLFPMERVGLPAAGHGAHLARVTEFMGGGVDQIEAFYRALEECGLVRLTDAATGKWEPVPPTSCELVRLAEAAGFDLEVALAFESEATARATESPTADLHPKPRFHPEPGKR